MGAEEEARTPSVASIPDTALAGIVCQMFGRVHTVTGHMVILQAFASKVAVLGNVGLATSVALSRLPTS